MMKRFVRFNLVGLMGAALQLALLDLLIQHGGLSGVAATPIAVEIVILHNFFWHERFTWPGLRQRAMRLRRFHLSNGLLSLARNTLLTYCLTHQFKVPPLASAVTAIVLCAPITFLAADRWVYRTNNQPPTTNNQLPPVGQVLRNSRRMNRWRS